MAAPRDEAILVDSGLMDSSPIDSRGVRLALDWGKARIGVAACDRDEVLAYPVETIDAHSAPLTRIQALVEEYEPVEVVLGWPRNLRGEEGPAAEFMRQIAVELEVAVAPVPVCRVDERLSTVAAARKLGQAGKSSRQQRGMIDQMAAVAILEHHLESRRHRGIPDRQNEGDRR